MVTLGVLTVRVKAGFDQSFSPASAEISLPVAAHSCLSRSSKYIYIDRAGLRKLVVRSRCFPRNTFSDLVVTFRGRRKGTLMFSQSQVDFSWQVQEIAAVLLRCADFAAGAALWTWWWLLACPGEQNSELWTCGFFLPLPSKRSRNASNAACQKQATGGAWEAICTHKDLAPNTLSHPDSLLLVRWRFNICVCNPWNHRDPFRLFCFGFASDFTAGGPSMYCVQWSNEAATVHADITADHRDVPANFVWHEAKPRTSRLDVFDLQMRAERRQPVRPSFVFFLFGPLLRLKTPRIRWFPTGTLRNWNLRPACGTAFSSVCISISVCRAMETDDRVKHSAAKVPYESVMQESHTRISSKSTTQGCPTREVS